MVGALLFTTGIAALMIALTEFGLGNAGSAWAWSALFGVMLILFVAQERRAPDPMISFRLWSMPIVAIVNGAALLGGMTLIGITTFLPMYVQIVLRQSSVVAGMALTMVMLGWPIGATLASKTFQRFGFWRLMVTGATLIPLGSSIFALLAVSSSPWIAAAGSFLFGLGMGLLSLSSIMVIQETVQVTQRGSATASNVFSRNLGSALGATVFGAVFNAGLTHSNSGVLTDNGLRLLLQGMPISAASDATLRTALAGSLHLTFMSMLIVSLLIVALAFLLPRADLQRTTA